MQKKKYKTSAENAGFSWVLANQVSDHVRKRWSTESADPWWLAVKGAQWDCVCYRKKNWPHINIQVSI